MCVCLGVCVAVNLSLSVCVLVSGCVTLLCVCDSVTVCFYHHGGLALSNFSHFPQFTNNFDSYLKKKEKYGTLR